MCPDITKEEEDKIIEEAVEASEKAEDPVETSEEVEEDQVFEGVDKVEDIPKGKEKEYGI